MPRRRPITPAVVRRLALALPETTESSHMGHPDFRVRDKIIAGVPQDWKSINLRTTPENLVALVAADPETFRDAWGGRWVGVRLDRVKLPLLRQLMADAWSLAAPKQLAATRRRSGR